MTVVKSGSIKRAPGAQCLTKAISSAVLLTILACIGAAAQSAPDDAVSVRNSLQQRLDSIDLEKQIRKRKGLSIEDLEKSGKAVMDSMAALRAGIEKRGESLGMDQPGTPRQDAKSRVRGALKYAPHSVFDWIVIGAGAVALIAGIVLCIGLISMIFEKIASGKQRGKMAPDALAYAKASTEKSVGHASALAALKSEIAQRTIETLRKRIGDEQDIIPASTQVPPPAVRPREEEPHGAQSLDVKKRGC